MKVTTIALLILLSFYGCSKSTNFVDKSIGAVLHPVVDSIGYGISIVLGKEKKEKKIPKEQLPINEPREYSKLMIQVDMAELKESIKLNSMLSLGKASDKYGGKDGITKHKKEVEIFMRQNCSNFALKKKRQYSHLDIYDFTLSSCNNLATKDLKMF